ncbi:hypothetical protein PV326_011354 [Microctonus aethiopoides]|nr:hypothetical protein PV326_011354 [Microctonus aethiopoides]
MTLLDKDSDMGHRLYNVCNRLSSQFKTKFRSDHISADDYEQPDVDEEVEDNGEVPGVEDREARRRDALHLVNALGCTKLSDEFYFDFVGIEWLHLGRWGENHPCEDRRSPVWPLSGTIYLIYSGDLMYK